MLLIVVADRLGVVGCFPSVARFIESLYQISLTSISKFMQNTQSRGCELQVSLSSRLVDPGFFEQIRLDVPFLA